MGQCKPRMFCYRCRSFWAWHLKGQFACLSKTVVHSLDLPIAQQFLSFWWTLIVCSSNLSNILTQSVKCLLREMLISLALVASACQPLFLNYAIEKSSNLWPHFRTQFWTQFRVQLWHLLLFFPYRVPNWAPKLVPKIGPQNESKLAPKTWPQIWLFSIVPFKNQGCQAHQSKKSQHSTQQVFFTDSLKRLELLAHSLHLLQMGLQAKGCAQYVCWRMQMGQCKPRMFCYRCRSFWAWHLKGQFACLSKTVVHSLDLPIAQQFLSFWWTLIVCSSNLSNILTQSVKCLLREMLISLALVASACQPLFLNYAIEKSSNLWPHFRTQFWTQFRVQLWHLLLFFPYRVPNWAPKLVPKIGPQNESKLAPKTWPQIWLFSIVPFKNQGCQAHQSKKSQHSTQQVFFTDSLKRLEGLLAHVPSPDVKKNSNWTCLLKNANCKPRMFCYSMAKLCTRPSTRSSQPTVRLLKNANGAM